MENQNKDLIKVLNTLVEINNDRIEGYQKASSETDETDLKALFAAMSAESKKLRMELSDAVTRMGGEPVEGTTTSGKFYRAWMDVKAALTAKDRKAILGSCEFGEDVALQTYESALKNEDLQRSQHQAMVQRHRDELKRSHDQIRNLRDSVEA